MAGQFADKPKAEQPSLGSQMNRKHAPAFLSRGVLFLAHQ